MNAAAIKYSVSALMSLALALARLFFYITRGSIFPHPFAPLPAITSRASTCPKWQHGESPPLLLPPALIVIQMGSGDCA